ncbi:MAG: glycoside hydrolase family 16 protein [Bacteroidia bacterium]|nr:glycoside hydrolase family 16 protein [Bacteroidia bacterium]
MASLKFLLGMIPSTAKIEQAEKALIAEFDKLKAFAESDTLKKYNELKELVTSSDFLQKKKEIESLSFKNSGEYAKEKELLALQKAKDIVLYFRTIAGSALKKFKELDGSDKITGYESLEKLVQSVEFREKMKSKEFKGTDDDKKLQEYNRLKSSSEIKDYYTFKKSKEYANFLNTDGSTRLARYNELKEYVATDDFKEKKNYLLDKKRFEKSEMFKELQEYDRMKKNEDILWYCKVKDSNKFDVLKNRELIFSDEFDGDKLDTKTWLTNYFWGDKLLKDNYTVGNDLQAYTEKDNFEIRNSVLKIITKPQKKEGKVWSTDGFKTKEFAYTSGIINTGKSFRQKYGTFTAKIKLGNPATKGAFWLLADKITPHLDVCRTSNGKVQFDYFATPEKKVKGSVGSKYANDFFIFTLEWTPDKLVWKVNDTEAFVQTTDVPQEPMYILFSGGLDKPISSMTSMEIDWIRVYQPKK